MGGVKKIKPKTKENTKLAQITSNMPVVLNDEHQSAMEYLNDCLNKPPIMAYPDFNSPFILHTDASELGLGAVLHQHQNGKPRVIAHGSRTLTPAEKGYHLHSGKLEFLALKWAVCDHFRDYLYHLHGQQPPHLCPFIHQTQCHWSTLGRRAGRL